MSGAEKSGILFALLCAGLIFVFFAIRLNRWLEALPVKKLDDIERSLDMNDELFGRIDDGGEGLFDAHFKDMLAEFVGWQKAEFLTARGRTAKYGSVKEFIACSSEWKLRALMSGANKRADDYQKEGRLNPALFWYQVSLMLGAQCVARKYAFLEERAAKLRDKALTKLVYLGSFPDDIEPIAEIVRPDLFATMAKTPT